MSWYVKFVLYNLSTFVLKNLCRLFDKYAVARTEHDALVKSTPKIFSNFVAFSENPNFNPLFLSDELGYLVDAIVNEDKIDSFDSRPNNMSLEVNAINTSMY